jgi:hypothetical protein
MINRLGIGLLVLTAGCALDGEQLGETEQGLTAYGLVDVNVNGASHHVDHDMGTSSDRTCFLMGLGGSLAADLDLGYGPAAHLLLTFADEWDLEDYPGTSAASLRVYGQCISVTANRSDEYSWDPQLNSTPVVMAAYSATSACFIEGVEQSRLEYDNSLFDASGDSLRITHDSTHWLLSGTGGGAGFARCITVASRMPEIQGSPGTIVNLADGGTPCFLTGIKGKFRFTDSTNGVFIKDDQGVRGLLVANTNQAWATCMK